jgi:hypothetical protein
MVSGWSAREIRDAFSAAGIARTHLVALSASLSKHDTIGQYFNSIDPSGPDAGHLIRVLENFIVDVDSGTPGHRVDRQAVLSELGVWLAKDGFAYKDHSIRALEPTSTVHSEARATGHAVEEGAPSRACFVMMPFGPPFDGYYANIILPWYPITAPVVRERVLT